MSCQIYVLLLTRHSQRNPINVVPRQNIVFVYATRITLVVLQSTPYW